MRHRGPDDVGIAYSSMMVRSEGEEQEVFIGAGHQRLAILDLDRRSAQPFQDGERILLFNGEIYNYKCLRADLESNSVDFRTMGDTEVLFKLLQHRGREAIDQLNGMWAFTYLDRLSSTVIASRDRYGKKPLFYYMDEEVLVFSSTVGALHAYLGRKPRLKRKAMDVYLQHGVMYPSGSHETHLHTIKQVLPGHTVQFDLATWKVDEQECYDGFLTKEAENPDIEELSETLKQAVEMRLISDRPIGLMLSGGVDSTLILSVLHSMGLIEQVRCYIGDTGKSPDAKYARECVEKLGVNARVVDLDYGDEAFSIFLRMCGHHEKAFPLVGNAMAMAEMYHRISEDDVPVVIDGTGGDEIFGGYWDRSFAPAVKNAFLSGDYAWIKTMIDADPGLRGKVLEILRGSILRNRFWQIDPKRARRQFQASYRLLGLNQALTESTDPLSCPSSDFTKDVLKDISPGGRLGEWIWHNDRNAMMSGVENRSPLLDFRLRRFIHTDYRNKMHEGWNKHELRSVFDKFAPLPSQWRRQKQGFRWDRKHFLKKNKNEALELIASSQCLSEFYNTRAYIDRAQKDDKIYMKTLTTRLLCIAGLEHAMQMIPENGDSVSS